MRPFVSLSPLAVSGQVFSLISMNIVIFTFFFCRNYLKPPLSSSSLFAVYEDLEALFTFLPGWVQATWIKRMQVLMHFISSTLPHRFGLTTSSFFPSFRRLHRARTFCWSLFAVQSSRNFGPQIGPPTLRLFFSSLPPPLLLFFLFRPSGGDLFCPPLLARYPVELLAD